MYVNVDLLALATNINYFSTLSATNGTSPAISLLVYESSFAHNVLGPNATASLVHDLPWQAFHEAGVYHKADNSMYVASNYVSLENPINITRIDLGNNYSISSTHFPSLALANGATSYYPPGQNVSDGQRPPLQLWCDEGTLDSPSQLVAVDPTTNTSQVLLNNYLGGHNFSSLNDVRQHPITGDIWFTDAQYGYFQTFRPQPTIPEQVYRFDPRSGQVSAVADGFTQCNGLEFSPDLRTLYVTDTGQNEFGLNDTRPATIYAFDVLDSGHGHRRRRATGLGNRRVFAYISSGSPDGIHADTAGNVWAGCGDGLHVWNRHGELIGKVFIGETCNNFAFVPDGVLVFANNRLYKVDGMTGGVQGREVCKDFGYKCPGNHTHGWHGNGTQYSS